MDSSQGCTYVLKGWPLLMWCQQRFRMVFLYILSCSSSESGCRLLYSYSHSSYPAILSTFERWSLTEVHPSTVGSVLLWAIVKLFPLF